MSTGGHAGTSTDVAGGTGEQELSEVTPAAAAPRPDVHVNTAQGLASELGGLSLGYGNAAIPAQSGADGSIGELFASEQRVVLPKKVRTQSCTCD
jgi:hypothetical protein